MVECHGAARRQDPRRCCGTKFWSLRLSVLTPRLQRRGAGKVEPAAAAGWSSINSPHHFPTMTDKQPSFNERCLALAKAADDLKEITAVVAREALHMTLAKERFAEKRSARSAKADR
jgi:hypothetical protein